MNYNNRKIKVDNDVRESGYCIIFAVILIFILGLIFVPRDKESSNHSIKQEVRK